MSFPRYPTYKDSSVEWLGDVPQHWNVRPLKHLARLQTGMTPPTDEWDNYTEEDGFQWVRPEDLDETGAPTKSSKFLTNKGWMQTRQIKAGASLICCIGTIGKVGIATDALSTNQQITAAEPREDSRYLFYAICASRTELELASTGNVLRILNTERLGNISCPNPPVPEQTQIAAFLDREITKIDALVAEQRRLMALLKEKRQAVISHAVTRGLNPHASLKPSGIEWLGDVPAHWKVKRLRDVANLNPSKSEIATIDRDSFVSFLPMSAIGEDGTLNLELEKPVGELESGYTYFRDGDVTIAKITPCYENGKGALMRGLTKGVGFGTTELIVVRPMPDESCGEFLHLLFVSTVFRNIGESHMYGAGGQKRVPDDFVRNFATGFPPVSEQIAINAFLKTELAKFDTLALAAQRTIDLLQERRTALISAAVTGQIDVRNVRSTKIEEISP